MIRHIWKIEESSGDLPIYIYTHMMCFSPAIELSKKGADRADTSGAHRARPWENRGFFRGFFHGSPTDPQRLPCVDTKSIHVEYMIHVYIYIYIDMDICTYI